MSCTKSETIIALKKVKMSKEKLVKLQWFRNAQSYSRSRSYCSLSHDMDSESDNSPSNESPNEAVRIQKIKESKSSDTKANTVANICAQVQAQPRPAFLPNARELYE